MDLLIKTENLFDNIVINMHNRRFVKKNINKLKKMAPRLGMYGIYNEINNIILCIESKIKKSFDLKDINMLTAQCKKAIQIIYKVSYSTIERLQEEISKTNIEQFKIISYDGDNFTLLGSTEFCYYHEIEITFIDVRFISCPGRVFFVNKFRKATDIEVSELKINKYQKEGFVICMEDNKIIPQKFFIVAHGIKYNWGTVFYYMRDDLQSGEKIAEDVKN